MEQPQNERDESLIQRLYHKDWNALSDLLRHYGGAMFAAAFSVLRNAADAEDAVSAAVLKICQSLFAEDNGGVNALLKRLGGKPLEQELCHCVRLAALDLLCSRGRTASLTWDPPDKGSDRTSQSNTEYEDDDEGVKQRRREQERRRTERRMKFDAIVATFKGKIRKVIELDLEQPDAEDATLAPLIPATIAYIRVARNRYRKKIKKLLGNE